MAAEYSIDLERLSDIEATINFTDPNNCAEAVRSFFNNAQQRDPLSDHTMLVRGFPLESFTMYGDRESIIPRTRRAIYNTCSKTLLLTMPGRPHEQVSRWFSRELDSKLENMNCRNDIDLLGSTTTTIGNIQKEADSSWGPLGAEYATCVLECGVSESPRALSKDADTWLNDDTLHVKEVITVSVYRNRPEIVFKVWKKADQQGSIPIYRRAIEDQVIHVTLEYGRPVADRKLCLSFEGLFERQPRRGTAERNLVFSTRELGRIARAVWIEVKHTEVAENGLFYTLSVGLLLPNHGFRIVDDCMQDVTAGERGQITLKGPVVSKGYYNYPESTMDSFHNRWFCTGDIGILWGKLLYIVDHKKGLIKYRRHQVAPVELEALLLSRDIIQDATVIGVQGEGTELPRAYIVADQAKISVEEIQRFVNNAVARYKQLRGRVVFIDEILKTASDKILRKDLRQLAARSRSKLRI